MNPLRLHEAEGLHFLTMELVSGENLFPTGCEKTASRDSGHVGVACRRRALEAWAATVTRPDLAACGRSLAEGAPTALPLAAPDAGDYGILAALARATSR